MTNDEIINRIAPNTPEDTPVLVNGQRGKLLLMWTDGTADVRMDDGQTLVDVPLVKIELDIPRCNHLHFEYSRGADGLLQTVVSA